MKLSNLKTVVYIGLALFYLYIIATNVFRNMEGMTTTIETIENKKNEAIGESSEDDAKESDTADSNAKPKSAAAKNKTTSTDSNAKPKPKPKPKSDDSADSSKWI